MGFVSGQTSSVLRYGSSVDALRPARFWDWIFFPLPAAMAIDYPGALTTAIGSGDELLMEFPVSCFALTFSPGGSG